MCGVSGTELILEVGLPDPRLQPWGAPASVRAVLTAGRLAESGGAGGRGSVSGMSGSAGDGPDGERHRAAVAEAWRHLGWGGKRGWLA